MQFATLPLDLYSLHRSFVLTESVSAQFVEFLPERRLLLAPRPLCSLFTQTSLCNLEQQACPTATVHHHRERTMATGTLHLPGQATPLTATLLPLTPTLLATTTVHPLQHLSTLHLTHLTTLIHHLLNRCILQKN